MKSGSRPQSLYEDKTFRWCSRHTDVDNSLLYPFGHGLSYTKYECSDISLSSETMFLGETLELKFKLSNTGEYDGTEVVQLYIRDLVVSVKVMFTDEGFVQQSNLVVGFEPVCGFIAH